MIVITDSNLIFSALITPNGSVAQVFKSKNKIQIIVPNFLFNEVYVHFDKILHLTGLTKIQLIEKIKIIKTAVKIVDTDSIPKQHIELATEIVKNIDSNDMFFVALHLYKKHKIWTGDKVLIDGLKAKGYNICVTTAELKQKIYKKPKK